MFRRSHALSLSLLLLAGCAAPTGAPTTAAAPTDQGPVVVSQLGEGPTQAATAPAAPAVPAVPVTTLDGSVSYRGEALAGYTLQVRDAQSDAPVAVLTDLSTAQGLAVGAGSLVTDVQGRFSLQVANLTAGTALRVTATKDHVTLETVLIGTPAKAGYTVQAASDGMSITELSTAIARIARGLVRTTQVLTPQAAQPVLERLNARLQALMPKLESELARMPEMAQQLVNPPKEGEPLDTVVANAGLRQSLTQAAADLVAEVAKQAQTDGNRAAAAADPAVQAQLAKIVLAGTALNVGYDPAKNAMGLVNRFTGKTADAATGDLGAVTRERTSSNNNRPSEVEEPVDPSLPDDVFKNVRLVPVDVRWSVGVIRLQPGIKPSDFTKLEAEMLDADGDRVGIARMADPSQFPHQDRVDRDGHPGYRMLLVFDRPAGDAIAGNLRDQELLDAAVTSRKVGLWNYHTKGYVDRATVTLYPKEDGLAPITFDITGRPIRRLNPFQPSDLTIPLDGYKARRLKRIEVDLFDADDRRVGGATCRQTEDLPEAGSTSVTVNFGPDEAAQTPLWEYRPFVGKPKQLVLRFTGPDGRLFEHSVRADKGGNIPDGLFETEDLGGDLDVQ